MIELVTVTVKVVVVAHCPAFGVKVYSVVAVLFNGGDQVPLMLLLDCIGKDESVSPSQTGATAVNVGIVSGFTVMDPFKVAFGEHPPDVVIV